jgi:hypothetical protein
LPLFIAVQQLKAQKLVISLQQRLQDLHTNNNRRRINRSAASPCPPGGTNGAAARAAPPHLHHALPGGDKFGHAEQAPSGPLGSAGKDAGAQPDFRQRLPTVERQGVNGSGGPYGQEGKKGVGKDFSSHGRN